MNEQEKWMKKRMEDIPKPIIVGTFEMNEEEKIKASEDLARMIEESKKKQVE